MIRLFLIFAFLFSLPAFAQRDTLHGRIMLAGANTPGTGVFVINKNTGAEVKTGAGGLFKITARNADRLVVYSDRTVVREFSVGKEWFAAMPYDLEVQPQGYELEEVVIVDETRSAEALGIVPKGQKHNTAAERRLYTATGDRPLWQYALGMLAGSMPFDPFINAITGKTEKMKKELATEQKQANVVRVSSIYNTAQLTDYLNIPAEKAEGFLYYAAESPTLLQAVNSNNPEQAKLELTSLATAYNSLQAAPATPNLQPATEND